MSCTEIFPIVNVPWVRPRNTYCKGWLTTDDLLVLTNLDQMFQILQTFVTFLQYKLPKRGGELYWPFPFSWCSLIQTNEHLQQRMAQYRWPPWTNYFIWAVHARAKSMNVLTKQATLMRRWTVLSLPLQCLFPVQTKQGLLQGMARYRWPPCN